MQPFIFAAAKDGDILLSSLDADNFEAAQELSLVIAADHFGMGTPVSESDFGGFTVSSLEGLAS